MNRLPTLLRSALAADPAGDAELLARYRDTADGEAFAELVRRHGRLVWAVCRHQTRDEADADDCFQAVWLALARKPAAVRDAARLSAFLHAVAVRVCRKLRVANTRRTARERATAVPDGQPAVPDTAWDRALAAVHDEVAALPEPLRVAFVRCGLEGQGVTEAAVALGWKLGTLSGRLTRAKTLLAKRLDARGLTAGAVAATVCGGTVPPVVAAKAASYATPAAVPASVLTLSQGVIVMNRVKLLAAGLLLAGGLGAGVCGGWVASVGAQDKPAAKAEPAKPAAGSVPSGKPQTPPATANPAPAEDKWEYLFHFDPNRQQGLEMDDFEREVDRIEARGYTFIGTALMKGTMKGGQLTSPPLPDVSTAYVFRRPKAKTNAGTPIKREGEVVGTFQTLNEIDLREQLDLLKAYRAIASPAHKDDVFGPATTPTSVALATAQKQRIAELEKQLAEAKVNLAASKTPRVTKRIEAASLRVPPGEIVGVVGLAMPQRFGADWGQRVRIDVTETALVLTGDAEAVNWTAGVIAAIGAK